MAEKNVDMKGKGTLKEKEEEVSTELTLALPAKKVSTDLSLGFPEQRSEKIKPTQACKELNFGFPISKTTSSTASLSQKMTTNKQLVDQMEQTSAKRKMKMNQTSDINEANKRFKTETNQFQMKKKVEPSVILSPKGSSTNNLKGKKKRIREKKEKKVLKVDSSSTVISCTRNSSSTTTTTTSSSSSSSSSDGFRFDSCNGTFGSPQAFGSYKPSE